ncbi:MAG: CocE/NonD family hydrolase [Bacteroidota bacterium]|nr:CocE/NonD family hydrolase [Bacteroidota bacterium]
MNKLFLFVFALFFSISLQAQNADSTWMREHYTKKEVSIKMRDGVRLFTSVYMPKDTTQKHPFLLTRTPYSCAPYGEDKWKPYWKSYVMAYLKEGFIMVTEDVRGRWMSEGVFEDVRPFNAAKKGKEIDEASDTYDAIDWLVKNIPGNNGKVGVFGISYPGFYSTMAAASNHPALKAVSPQAPVTNWFLGDDFHHNGAFFVMDGFAFYSSFGKPRPLPTSVGPTDFNYYTHDNYQFYLETGTLKQLETLIGDSVQFWKELYQHPNYDAWWQARDARKATVHLNPAMLWVGGNFDAEDNWGAWNAYRAAEQNNPGKAFNKIVMGPWYHGQWASKDGTHLGNVQWGSNTSTWYQQNIEIPFFNSFLLNKGDVSNIAEATIFVTGKNEWKNFSEWPPAGAQNTPIYLQDSGRLGFNKPGGSNSFAEYTSDPAKPVPYTDEVHFERTREYMTDDQRFAARRPDVLVFQSDTLTDDVTVTGNVVANIFASLSTTDADFVVKVIDVFPDLFSYKEDETAEGKGLSRSYPVGGYEMLVHGEIFRGKYRNSFEKPEAFTPNKIEKVSFKLADIAHAFLKGHRIMIQIQSSWFPLVDRNPQKFENIYEATEKDFQKADIKIYHSDEYPSNIVLPIFK